MSEIHSGESFVDIQDGLRKPLHPGTNPRNTFMAEEGMGNEGPNEPAEDSQPMNKPSTEYSDTPVANTGSHPVPTGK